MVGRGGEWEAWELGEKRRSGFSEGKKRAEKPRASLTSLEKSVAAEGARHEPPLLQGSQKGYPREKGGLPTKEARIQQRGLGIRLIPFGSNAKEQESAATAALCVEGCYAEKTGDQGKKRKEEEVLGEGRR